MIQSIIYCPVSVADERRWLSATGIVNSLPRDRFEVREFSTFNSVDVGPAGRTWILFDSEDTTASGSILEAARKGVATAIVVADPTRPLRVPVGAVGEWLVESRWSAEFLRKAHGIEAQVLSPMCIRPKRPLMAREARFATFIDPIAAHGVDLFVRLAEELGRRRPDIPLLIVEGRGTEADLVDRGIDLRTHTNIHLMTRPTDPVRIWEVTRLLLAPLLDPWVGGFLADATCLGIPIVASDCPPFREILCDTAVFAPIPGWMTPCSRRLPDPSEIETWVDAVLGSWDDPKSEHSREYSDDDRTRSEPARRSEAASIFAAVPRATGPRLVNASASREGWAVLVPFMNTIEPECESALHVLEQAGVRVVRCRGSSAIDHARSLLASEALKRGSRSILFIDSDIAFDPADALRLFTRPEPVVAGVYTKKNKPALASSFTPQNSSVIFGAAAPGLYPLEYAAAGFLRIQTDILRLMVQRLALPLCNTHVGEGFWPFFLPLVLPRSDGSSHYLSEDWAFSHRLMQIGITPFADTTIRLHHLGMHGYTWEDTMRSGARYESFTFNFSGHEEQEKDWD